MEAYIYSLIIHIQQLPGWSIFLGAFVSGLAQVAFPPYPGELVLALCGCIVSNMDVAQGVFLFLTYWTAIVSANIALYSLGASKGEKLLNSHFVSRFMTRESSEKIKKWLLRYGFLVFLTAIYIPGMYLPMVFFSGMMKYSRIKAILGMLIATLIHDSLLFLGGRYLGGNLRQVAGFIATYKDISVTVVISLISIFIAYRIIMLLKRRSQPHYHI